MTIADPGTQWAVSVRHLAVQRARACSSWTRPSPARHCSGGERAERRRHDTRWTARHQHAGHSGRLSLRCRLSRRAALLRAGDRQTGLGDRWRSLNERGAVRRRRSSFATATAISSTTIAASSSSPGCRRKASRKSAGPQLIEPTHPYTRRREAGAVLWSHAAYANKHIIIRNDKEIVRFSLAKEP